MCPVNTGTALPLRGDGTIRPAGLPLPPARMPLLRGGRPLKRWRYVGVYGPDVMLCAASARIGGIPQAFWAVLDRTTGELADRTAFTRGLVAIDDGRLIVSGKGIDIDLALQPAGEPVVVVSPHGDSFIWTRKDPVRAIGRVTVMGRTHEIDHAGLVDATAGYHARETIWRWSAGVGTATDGRSVAWNLVTGVHDAPEQSERTVWIDGVAAEAAPVSFPGDLEGVGFADVDGGGQLRFALEAERARSDDLKIFASDYRQPFGTFTRVAARRRRTRRGLRRHGVARREVVSVSASEHRVILLRHGETEWSRERRHTGRTDVPLTDAGVQEAQSAGRRLAGAAVDHVLVSPLIRARQTCELAGFATDAVVQPALVEWDYGAYEGRTSVEIRAERPSWSLWRDGCPDGEDAAAVGARVDPVVARCRELPASWLIVAHGHVLRVLAARWCGLDPEAGSLLQLGTAAICILGFEHDTPGIRLWNDEGTPLNLR